MDYLLNLWLIIVEFEINETWYLISVELADKDYLNDFGQNLEI